VHLRSYIVDVKLFLVLLLVVGSLSAQTDRAGLDEGFDNPVKKTVVDLGHPRITGLLNTLERS
jgi:hypothetical protein